jgi:hypothetical protein
MDQKHDHAYPLNVRGELGSKSGSNSSARSGPDRSNGRNYPVNAMNGLSWIDYALIAAALLAALYALRLFKNIEP